jgi:hypothetical protein
MQYTVMGRVSRIRMRPGCVPTRFTCQPTRVSVSSTISRPVAVKRRRLALIRECEEEMRTAGLLQSRNLKVELFSPDEGW